ncbi:DUF551 domain-containing protein [Escherichia coli]|nr:DUF551 domain-containing protein [Escherichia coli]
MITITKGRLLTIKQWRETYGPGSNVVLPAEEAEELARIALVSLEAEPVAKIIAHYPLGVDVGKQKFVQAIGELPDFGGYLFAAPPAPIVPEEMYWQDAPVEDSSKAAAYATGWNACRAAMLHSAEPVSQAYKLNALDGNSPVTPDGWISCSERMPAQDDWILIYSKHGEYMAGQVQGEYVELSDGTLSWLGNALYWMPLPEPPQEVN